MRNLTNISQKLYENMGDIHNTLMEVIGDFEWPISGLYNEQSASARVTGELDNREVCISLYRYHTGRYELVAYYTGVKA